MHWSAWKLLNCRYDDVQPPKSHILKSIQHSLIITTPSLSCLPLGFPCPPFPFPFAISSVCARWGLCDAERGHKGDSSGLGQIISVLCHGQGSACPRGQGKGLSLCASPIQCRGPSAGHCNEVWGTLGEPVPGPIDASAKAAFNLLLVGLDC